MYMFVHVCACVYVFPCSRHILGLALEHLWMVMWWLVRLSQEDLPGSAFISAVPEGQVHRSWPQGGPGWSWAGPCRHVPPSPCSLLYLALQSIHAMLLGSTVPAVILGKVFQKNLLELFLHIRNQESWILTRMGTPFSWPVCPEFEHPLVKCCWDVQFAPFLKSPWRGSEKPEQVPSVPAERIEELEKRKKSLCSISSSRGHKTDPELLAGG